VIADRPHASDRSEFLARIVNGLAWTAAAKGVTQALTWTSTLIVVRLLAPADYGLVGMAAAYLGLATVLSEFGVGTAVVYLRDLTEDQVAQLNVLAISLGALTCVTCAGLAPAVAAFFQNPTVRPIVMVMSTAFLVSAFQVVPSSRLQRDKAFKNLALADGARAIVQSFITVILAMMGQRYWSLVYGGLAGAMASSATLVWLRPTAFRAPKLGAIRSAASFSGHVLLTRLSWYAYENADVTIAGRVLGDVQLGAYSVAWNLASTLTEKPTELISRVGPAFVSDAQHDPSALRRYLQTLTEGVSLITFPATVGLALLAPEFTQVVLGPRWGAAATPLRLLALYASIRSITTLFSPLLTAIDLRWASRYSLVFPLLLPLAFYVGSRWGTAGIAAAWVLLYPPLYLPIGRRLFTKIGLRWREYLQALWPALSATVVMSLVVIAVKATVPVAWPLALRFASEVAAGAVVYLSVIGMAHHHRYARLARSIRARWRPFPCVVPQSNPLP
jgi:PST family polysaccharide transporter